MRQNPNSRRSRGRGGRKPGSSRSQVFDSNGPGARVRGNSSQIYEKYQQLARDASSSGDRVAAENFYQHAEHYYRLMEAAGLNRSSNAHEDAQQRTDGAATNGEPVAVADSASERPAESEAVAVEITEAQQPEAQEPPPEATNGSDKSEDEAKPVRRTRSRRSNGSENGKSAPDKDADAAASEEDSEKLSEDTGPVNA